MKSGQNITNETIDNARLQLQELQEATTCNVNKKKAAILLLAESIKQARSVGRAWKEIAETLKNCGITVSPVYLQQVIKSAPSPKVKGRQKAKEPASPSPSFSSSPSPTTTNGRNAVKPDRLQFSN